MRQGLTNPPPLRLQRGGLSLLPALSLTQEKKNLLGMKTDEFFKMNLGNILDSKNKKNPS